MADVSFSRGRVQTVRRVAVALLSLSMCLLGCWKLDACGTCCDLVMHSGEGCRRRFAGPTPRRRCQSGSILSSASVHCCSTNLTPTAASSTAAMQLQLPASLPIAFADICSPCFARGGGIAGRAGSGVRGITSAGHMTCPFEVIGAKCAESLRLCRDAAK